MMKKTLKVSTLVVATSLAVGSSVALADDYASGGHPYVSVGAGYGVISGPNSAQMGVTDPPKNTGVQEGGLATSTALGYLWDMDAMGIGAEVSYNTFPTTHYTNSVYGTNSINANTFNLMAVAKFYATPDFNMGVKVGAAYSMQQVDVGSNYVNGRNSWLPAVGVGVGYNLTQHVEWTLDGQYIFGRTNSAVVTNGAPQQTLASVTTGLKYNF